MENIFVVTDFSAASRNAALYGIALAKQFGAKLFLFHAYQVPVQIPESYLFYTTEDVWKTVKELLEKEVVAIDPEKVVDIEICGGEGAAAHSIIQHAGAAKADLIICGMKETIKGLRRIFGSTTTALTRLSEIPFLVIPEDATFSKPVHIALASDMDTETAADTVALLKEFGKAFQSKLSIVWVVENEVDEAYKRKFRPEGITRHLKDMEPGFEFPAGNSISAALEGFAKDHSIDMMAIIPHKHSFMERFFVESTTASMIFHTHIPLLVLPQKKESGASSVMNSDKMTRAFQ
ncbi:hypothetical protein BH11BAC4_BH11BAC4_18430 [soil metagenome]